jgi:signal transduction histidine kinase
VQLHTSCTEVIEITTDRGKLERIVNNLVSNAVKFTPGGSVRVEVDQSIHGFEIHVIDTGVGIAPEHQGRLFEDFYQINNHERDRKKGFGLGLSISRRLARQLEGDLLVDSALGRGSRFTIILPKFTEPSRAGENSIGATKSVGV